MTFIHDKYAPVGHSSNETHLLLTVSITGFSDGQTQPTTQTAGQNIGPLPSQVRGHKDAHMEGICPSISHSWIGWHLGQHFPSGTTSFSSSWQTGRRHRTTEQSGSSGRVVVLWGTHSEQHSPSGTTSFSPLSQSGSRQETAEQSSSPGTHSGQHSPSGTSSFPPGAHSGNLQRTVEQSVAANERYK